jgi:hypothetical protein
MNLPMKILQPALVIKLIKVPIAYFKKKTFVDLNKELICATITLCMSRSYNS